MRAGPACGIPLLVALGLAAGCGGAKKPASDSPAARDSARQACHSFLLVEGLTDESSTESKAQLLQDLKEEATTASQVQRYEKLGRAVAAYEAARVRMDAVPAALRARIAKVGLTGLTKAEQAQLDSYLQPDTDAKLKMVDECRALSFAGPAFGQP